LTAALNESPAKAPERSRRRRFSAESLNDLLFWGLQLTIIAVGLGIIWLKVDALASALKTILKSEEAQNQTLLAQANAEQIARIEAQQAEHTRSIQFSAAMGTLQTVLAHAAQIQTAVQDTLAKATETNNLVLAASQEAQKAAQNAASAAGGAAGAASRAAALSSHTSSVVATKVVTSSAKEALLAQKAALARKEAQLSRTIKQVKKNGPTLLQRLFNQ
jgi:hypothetical protein